MSAHVHVHEPIRLRFRMPVSARPLSLPPYHALAFRCMELSICRFNVSTAYRSFTITIDDDGNVLFDRHTFIPTYGRFDNPVFLIYVFTSFNARPSTQYPLPSSASPVMFDMHIRVLRPIRIKSEHRPNSDAISLATQCLPSDLFPDRYPPATFVFPAT